MARSPSRCRRRSRTPRQKSKEEKRRRSRSARRRRRKERRGRDKDKDTPHFTWEAGMTLGPEGRYTVERLMGDGTFGRVLRCLDSKTKEVVAVKVVKGVKRYCDHARAEAEILREIHRLDTKQESLCVRIFDSFDHTRHHFCLVLELLDTSVRDFLKANQNQGLYLADAREMARQLLQSLAYLHGIGLTHTDLKCRNVMLRDGRYDLAPHPRASGEKTMRPKSCSIAVIDFGGAVFEDEIHGGRIGTRQFRGPEIVLGLPWDHISDMWSAGCIIAMLYLGQRPFSVHEDMEHLAMMERLLETKIPTAMAKEAMHSEDLPEGIFFTEDGRLDWPSRAPEEEAIERVQDLQPLREQVLPRHRSFLALLQGLLQIDPDHRLAAAQALTKCSFFVDPDVQE